MHSRLEAFPSETAVQFGKEDFRGRKSTDEAQLYQRRRGSRREGAGPAGRRHREAGTRADASPSPSLPCPPDALSQRDPSLLPRDSRAVGIRRFCKGAAVLPWLLTGSLNYQGWKLPATASQICMDTAACQVRKKPFGDLKGTVCIPAPPNTRSVSRLCRLPQICLFFFSPGCCGRDGGGKCGHPGPGFGN